MQTQLLLQSLRGAGVLSAGPVHAPLPPARGPQARPHLVASIPQALQGQTLTLRVEKVHQGLGQGKKAEPAEASRLRRVEPEPLLTPSAPAQKPAPPPPPPAGGGREGNANAWGSQLLLTEVGWQAGAVWAGKARPPSRGAKGCSAASGPGDRRERPRRPGRDGSSTRPYLQREVEAAVEIRGDIEVCTEGLQDGLQEQLPEGLQHPAGTLRVGGRTAGPTLLTHPEPYLLRFSFTSDAFSRASFSSRYFMSGATACGQHPQRQTAPGPHPIHPQPAAHSLRRSGWSLATG